jgi:mannose-1-phosphate guanylyltransferase
VDPLPLPPAMVLAAGFGTRLAPLTDELPKALCPIGDRPQIDHVLAYLARCGVPRAVVNVHHKADAFDPAWVNAQPFRTEISRESEILGTAGGIHHAAAILGDRSVIVWNADILADVDLTRLVVAHAASQCVATLAVCEDAAGKVGVDREGRVVRLRDTSFGDEKRAFEYLGVAVLGRALLDRLPAKGCLVADALIPALRDGLAVGTYLHRGAHVDTGSLEAYLGANVAWLGERRAFVGEGALVDPGVTLERTVVGQGARVTGAGLVEACVIWPGATARAPLERANVTPRGVSRLA